MELVGCRDVKAELRQDGGINSPLLRLLNQVLYKKSNSKRQREMSKPKIHTR